VIEKEKESLKQLEEFITREYKQQNIKKRLSRPHYNSNEEGNEKEKNHKVRMLSSLMHDATSRILKLHNIDHVNEKSLLFNYIVDVFIPYKESLPWGSVLKKDVVLEIDGPFHFESFANAPLGPVLMKRRHIEAAGYHFVSLPLSLYQKEGGKNDRAKGEYIKDLITKGVISAETRKLLESNDISSPSNASPSSEVAEKPSWKMNKKNRVSREKYVKPVKSN